MIARSVARRKGQSETRGQPEKSAFGGVGSVEQGTKGVYYLLTFLAIVGSIHVLAMLSIESVRMIERSREIGRLQADVEILAKDIFLLQAINRHGQSEAYLEQLARCSGYIYPDEERFVTILPQGVPLSELCPKQTLSPVSVPSRR